MRLIKINEHTLINADEIVSVRKEPIPIFGNDVISERCECLKFGLTNGDSVGTLPFEASTATRILGELSLFLRGHAGCVYEIGGDNEGISR